MGACLALCSVASCASCLCGSAPCLLCGCCPSSNNSTITRLVFSFFLLLGTLVSVIMILPGMEAELQKIPGLCQGGSSIPGLENHVKCEVIVGYKSVYRMCFAMTCFFFLFCAIMIGVRSSKDPRAGIQNGYVLHQCSLEGMCSGLGTDGGYSTVYFIALFLQILVL
uniref:Serine incorporator 2 n=1 Tax=Labrus bergylta TaxID=56723 RepID=A0A3Q3EPH7_9LABR